MGTPLSNFEQRIINIIESDYDVSGNQAELAVSRAKEAGDLNEEASAEDYAEMIYTKSDYWR